MLPMLIAEGHHVLGLDSDLFEGCIFGDSEIYGESPCINYLKKDIRDVNSSDLRDVDTIIHLCALSNDPLGDFNPDITYEINHKASVNLARIAKQGGVNRFIFTSSCSVYGNSSLEIVNENTKPNPVTPYGVSKLLAERDISKLADSDFSPVFLRPATAYGLSPMLRFDLVLNNFIAWAFTTGIVLLKSDGSAWRPIIHIEDISRAFIAVLHASKDLTHNQIFNVGITEENYLIRDLAEIVKRIVPNSQIKYSKDAQPDKRSYKVDFSKIKVFLPNFNPQWNATCGAIQLYNAFRKVNISLEDFEGPRYRRISHLEASILSGTIDKNLRKNGVYKYG